MKEYFTLIYNKTQKDYFNYLSQTLNNQEKKFIITVNPETIMNAEKNSELENIIKNKSFSLVPDGIAIIKKAKQYGIKINERITGIDISTYLLKEANKKHYSMYLFGAKSDVLYDLVNLIKDKYPNIKILGFTDGYVTDKDEIMDNIIRLNPDICLVALGVPAQELLIGNHFAKVKHGIYIGVGGSFDTLSGHKKRAPKIFIKLNLEWLYRICSEPKRFKRFFQNNIAFMLRK